MYLLNLLTYLFYLYNGTVPAVSFWVRKRLVGNLPLTLQKLTLQKLIYRQISWMRKIDRVDI